MIAAPPHYLRLRHAAITCLIFRRLLSSRRQSAFIRHILLRFIFRLIEARRFDIIFTLDYSLASLRYVDDASHIDAASPPF